MRPCWKGMETLTIPPNQCWYVGILIIVLDATSPCSWFLILHGLPECWCGRWASIVGLILDWFMCLYMLGSDHISGIQAIVLCFLFVLGYQALLLLLWEQALVAFVLNHSVNVLESDTSLRQLIWEYICWSIKVTSADRLHTPAVLKSCIPGFSVKVHSFCCEKAYLRKWAFCGVSGGHMPCKVGAR